MELKNGWLGCVHSGSEEEDTEGEAMSTAEPPTVDAHSPARAAENDDDDGGDGDDGAGGGSGGQEESEEEQAESREDSEGSEEAQELTEMDLLAGVCVCVCVCVSVCVCVNVARALFYSFPHIY